MQVFLRHYFRHVDAVDVDERSVEDLLGLVVSHYRAALHRPAARAVIIDPDAQPERRRLDRRRRHRGPDRHRRPAVPGRLGDHGGAPPGLEHPRGVPSPVPGPPRPRGHAARHRPLQPRRLTTPRSWPSPGCTWRSCRRPGPDGPDTLVADLEAGPAGGAAAGRGGGRGLAEDDHPVRGDHRAAQGPDAHRRPGRGGRPRPRAAGLAERQPLHLPRLPRVRAGRSAGDRVSESLEPVPATGLGILRADQDVPGAFHALPAAGHPARPDGDHQGQLQVPGAPAGLPGLHRLPHLRRRRAG